jgi:ribosomal protein L20
MKTLSHKSISKKTKGMRSAFGFKMASNKYKRALAYSHKATRIHSRDASTLFIKGISNRTRQLGSNYSQIRNALRGNKVFLDKKTLYDLSRFENVFYQRLSNIFLI